MAQMRRRRQRETAMASTNSISTSLAGWNCWMWASRRSWNCSWDSAGSTTDLAERPWRRLLRDDLARPSGVAGPRDLAPLARAVWILRLDDIMNGLRAEGSGRGRWEGRAEEEVAGVDGDGGVGEG